MDARTVVQEPEITTLVNKTDSSPAVKGNRKTTSHQQIYKDKASRIYYDLPEVV